MSFQLSKTDPKLGKEVQEFLESVGVATPMVADVFRTDKERIEDIADHFKEIMKILKLDLSDDSLEGTPLRVGKMFIKELFWGLNPDFFPKCTVVDNKMKYDEMIVEKCITSMSSCEHHFVTIDGQATVAYIPKEKVLGLSKMNRIVEYFSRRPQIQERLTEQIYHALRYILDTEDVAVVISATHYCVKSRGVEDGSSYTLTSKLGGSFKTDQSLRSEFMSLVRG